ncbi:hypothetical protein KKF91_03105, partial [Myxococcota bacterium]|nr:hypothetical protein [Myxococcota bacterium]
FTRAPDGGYALAAELIVKAKTKNPAGFEYGPYRVSGDLKRSRYFKVASQRDLSPLVRGFQIKTGRPDRALGGAFQGAAAVREIDEVAHMALRAYAADLPLEPRAQLIPEERLEWASAEEDEALIETFLRAEAHGLSAERQLELRSPQRRARNRKLVLELRERYEGRCQLTGWDPRAQYGQDLCEAHHVHWLGRGGDDALNNLILISPNLHRVVHHLDAPFDYERQAFLLGGEWAPLQLSEHALVPSL